MRRDEKGYALAGKLKKQVPQRAAGDGIDPCCRLVKKNHLGRVDDGTRESEALLPSAGKLARAAIHIWLNAGKSLKFACALGGSIARQAIDAGVEIHVLSDGEVFVQAELLRHVADVASNLGSILANVHAENAAGALCRLQQSAERLDDGGLARAVGAEKSEEFTFPHFEANVADRSERAEANGEMVGCNHGRHSRRTVADIPDLRICCALST